MTTLDWGGQSWTLLPDRAMWWAARRTLIVADLHLGKAAAFRAAGLPVPEAVTAHDLGRLAQLVRGLSARRLIVLGDLLHASTGVTSEVTDRVSEWRDAHGALHVVLVRGNHDRRSGDPPENWNVETVDPPLVEGPLAFVHEVTPIRGRYVVGGHLHPGVRVHDGGGSLHAPCFWFGTRTAVLPAFGSFTGCARVRPARGDRVFAAGPECVERVRVVGRARSRSAG